MKKKIKDHDVLPYTDAQWRKDIDELHGKGMQRFIINEEQMAFIDYARSQDPPVSWQNISMIWQKQGWGKRHREGLRIKWEKMKKDA